ncbi:MAG: PilZ domain-containing protein [Magnetococcales bacterium]|nr:PilZ domain-containing protein [Magnetococcales bacterium]
MAKAGKKKRDKGNNSDGEKPGKPETATGSRVLQLLKKGHENDSVVELRINNLTQIFYANFCDLPAKPAEESEKSGKTKEKKTAGTKFEHLKKKSYLLLTGIVPEEGNKRAKKGNKVLIRFYDGKKAIEGKARFLKKVLVDGKTFIKTEFPKTLKVHKQRRHYRVKVLPEVDLRITSPFAARVIDMSVQGLSFCFPSDAEQLENGSQVTLNLKIPPTLEAQEKIKLDSGLEVARSNSESIEFTGFIRNFNPISGDNKICPPGSKQCGVQFDITSAIRSMEIGEVYTFIEREFLRSLAKKKPENGKKLKSLLPEDAGKKTKNLWSQMLEKMLSGET